MIVICAKCGQQLRAPDSPRVTKLRCPGCKTEFTNTPQASATSSIGLETGQKPKLTGAEWAVVAALIFFWVYAVYSCISVCSKARFLEAEVARSWSDVESVLQTRYRQIPAMAVALEKAREPGFVNYAQVNTSGFQENPITGTFTERTSPSESGSPRELFENFDFYRKTSPSAKVQAILQIESNMEYYRRSLRADTDLAKTSLVDAFENDLATTARPYQEAASRYDSVLAAYQHHLTAFPNRYILKWFSNRTE